MAAPILLCEDDPGSALLTNRALRAAHINHDLKIFTNGTDALLYLENEQNPLPCLILLDLGLPGIHGLDVLRYIRDHDRADIAGLPVFILTLNDDQKMLTETIDHGANAFLSKNLDIGLFLKAAHDAKVVLDIGEK